SSTRSCPGPRRCRISAGFKNYVSPPTMKRWRVFDGYFQICNNALFFIPVLLPIYLNRGFNMQQILFAETIFYITIFISEIPTGAIADLLGKKYSMSISSIGSAISCVLLYCTQTYIWLILSQILFGVAMTLSSGADSAYLYNYLKDNGQHEKYSSYEGKSYSFSIFFATLTTALGGIVFKVFSEAAPFLFSSIFYFIAGIVALKLPEAKAERKLNVKQHIIEYYIQIKQSLIIVYQNKKLLNLTLIYGIFFMYSQLNIWINQIYLKNTGVSVALYGVIIAGLGIGSTFLSWNIGVIRNKINSHTLIYISCLLLPVCLLFLGIIPAFYSFVFLLMLNIAKGVFFPVVKQELNLEIPDKNRATILSVQSSIGNIFFALFAPVFGKAIDNLKLNYVFMATALFICLIFTWPLCNTKKYMVRKRAETS
ncbi:MAG: MFS transporter, partial [Firmicutes bacterium]|nr:MFS transporter [Bacillota bacterium]